MDANEKNSERDRLDREPEPPAADSGQGDPDEDPFIEASMQTLESVQVPRSFLPNVMYQVYEIHHRDKISVPKTAIACLALLALSVAFYFWDVADAAARGGIPFGEAFSLRLRAVMVNFDSVFSAISGMVAAAWQLAVGVSSRFLGGVIGVGVLLLAASATLFVFARKAMSAR